VYTGNRKLKGAATKKERQDILQLTADVPTVKKASHGVPNEEGRAAREESDESGPLAWGKAAMGGT